MKRSKFPGLGALFFLVAMSASAAEPLAQEAAQAMERATRFFRTEVAVRGGYLWNYKSDFTLREGELPAPATAVWVQPPGTPGVGLVLLEAYAATGNRYFLEGAVAAAEALVWGQLASGGWDSRIDFDTERSKAWYFRRDLLAGDTTKGRRRNSSLLDDNMTQSALLLLMRVDRTLEFKQPAIHAAVLAGLKALLEVQYPNGAWPQHFEVAPDPAKYPVRPARYPATWSREFPRAKYYDYYTFNDGCMTDTMATMIEAHRIYGDERYLAAARRLGDFILLAQMPEPQPAWAQQYNSEMEPAWARKFEPPAVTGGETRDVLRALLDLHRATGDTRYLKPIPGALAWVKRSLLPDGRLARFYELKTNRPLYFTKAYELTYDDSDVPTHYSFKSAGSWVAGVEKTYERALAGKRDEPKPSAPNAMQVRAVIDALDARGRWVEQGRLRVPEEPSKFMAAEIISCATFNRNLSLLAHYVKAQQAELGVQP
ncbi:MAG: hypothetical protein RIQ93_1619 [Verrucomicrobiota bacterium]|jgi:PelA/Pel-15E family pectate lyase